MFRKYTVESWDEADYQSVSQLSATAVLVKQTALTLHIVGNYIVWWRTEIGCTNRNWNTVLIGQEPIYCRYESRAQSSALELTVRSVWSISRAFFTPCTQYLQFVHVVFCVVYFLSLVYSPYSGQRRCCSASSVVYGGQKERTLCVCPHFWYPNLLNRIKFDTSIYSVSCANFVACFDGDVLVFAKTARCAKVRKLSLHK
jgi:hypothetical protein